MDLIKVRHDLTCPRDKVVPPLVAHASLLGLGDGRSVKLFIFTNADD